MSKSDTTITDEDTLAYTYNPRSEIITAHAQNDPAYHYDYTFDAIGNRLTSTESGTNTTYTANPLNQYTTINTFTPQFDPDGNQLLIQTTTGIWIVHYNAENRPILWIQGDTRIEMTYDHMGRRVSYKSMTGNTINRHALFFYKDYLLLQEIDAVTGKTTKEFVWDPTEPTATKPLQIRYPESEKICFYLTDGNKNISDVLSQDGAAEAHYEYAPFGTLAHQTGTLDNPFRFSSEFYDSELGLIAYNYRTYSPSLGRWLSPDPINEPGFSLAMRTVAGRGVKERNPRSNYLFVQNSPLRNIDTLGLRRCKTPCEDAKKYGLSGGAIAGVVCCCGKKYACIWTETGGATRPTNSIAKAHIKKCVTKHETTHFDHMNCPNDNSGRVSRPPFKDIRIDFIYKSECDAYTEEYNCLQNALEDDSCKNDPACKDQVKAESDLVEKRKKKFCKES